MFPSNAGIATPDEPAFLRWPTGPNATGISARNISKLPWEKGQLSSTPSTGAPSRPTRECPRSQGHTINRHQAGPAAASRPPPPAPVTQYTHDDPGRLGHRSRIRPYAAFHPSGEHHLMRSTTYTQVGSPWAHQVTMCNIYSSPVVGWSMPTLCAPTSIQDTREMAVPFYDADAGGDRFRIDLKEVALQHFQPNRIAVPASRRSRVLGSCTPLAHRVVPRATQPGRPLCG